MTDHARLADAIGRLGNDLREHGDITPDQAVLMLRASDDLRSRSWQPIESEGVALEPGTEVLAAFKGQFKWVVFVARVGIGGELSASNYAAPTHWQPIIGPEVTK